PMSETTACMPLSLINDEGLLAFCESDFVVIPSGVLLNHIAATPVFLNDPTYPHDGVITLAHCTAPSKMDGKRPEKVTVLTHYESDYGAAPKVDMRIGQPVTVIDPDFRSKRWIGFRGKIDANPFLDICRSQVDVTIEGDWERLAEEMAGFHWMLSYGDHLKETGYALRKMNIGWLNISETGTVKA
ncbi:MAG TPA: sugar isomerase, partial [Candidatus Hydrogenedentes bacterium]|nr:sugar isomerase [Candidatus Hydrogenedentota bacterium]